jgi:hypothetical protein
MPITNQTLSLTTAAQQIPVNELTEIVGIYVPVGATQAVYLGGSNVSAENGLVLAAGSTIWITNESAALAADSGWYLVAAGAQSVNIATGS